MNCINIKSKEFQELLEASKLPSLLLEMRIAKWQEQNGLDNFPKVEDIIQSNKIILDNTRDESTIFMKKDLSEFESEENESVFSEKPILQNRAEVREIDNPIVSLLFNNNSSTYTTSEIIRKLSSMLNGAKDKFLIDVLQKLNKLNSIHNVIIKVLPPSEFKNGEVMKYNSDTKEIYISTLVLEGYDTNTIASTLLHEITHHITVDLLSKPYEKLTFAEKQYVDVISKFYNKYKGYKHNLGNGANFNYGFTDIFEFVAEFYGNPDFREYTKTLSDNWYNKLIKALGDAFRRILSLPLNPEYQKLMDTIFNYVESVPQFELENGLYVKDMIFAKKITDPDEIDLTTIDKRLDNVVGKAQDRVKQLYNRAKKSKKSSSETFLKAFKELKDELDKLSETKKWHAVVKYTKSFQNTVNSLHNRLDNKFTEKEITYNGVTYERIENFEAYQSKQGQIIIPEDVLEYYKDSDLIKNAKENDNLVIDTILFNNIENESIKELDNQDHLDLAFEYEEYLNAYDLLEDIQKLLDSAEKDKTLSREDKLEVREIKNILHNLTEKQHRLKGLISKIKKESGVKLFANSSNNKKVITDWKNKLTLKYNKLTNPKLSKDEWIGEQMNTVYYDEIQKDLEKAAREIIENPYTDITKFSKTWEDLLNINSPLINIMSNIIGKMRNVIIDKINNASFEFGKMFDKYSKVSDSLSMSKKYANLLQLSKSKDRYYLKGKYSVDFIDSYNKILEEVSKNKKDIKYKKWLKENTETFYDEEGNQKIRPAKKYLNPELSGVEKETLDFFINKTKKNNEENYKGKSGLIKNLFGAEFYILPSVTKSNKERTLEGDIKGQIKDKITDLTTTKVDDISHGEAFDTKGNELRRIKINYRGKLPSKDQSLDLFNIYRLEETNAIVYKERSERENQLKLFVNLASEKEYKKRSLKYSGWAKNIFAENVKGQTFSGEHSNELNKIQGLLETHLYDVLSYTETKLLGTLDANKLTSSVNGLTAAIAMTANIGSATVNSLNGLLLMQMKRFGGDVIKGSNLEKAELNYTKNLPQILADFNSPVKKSFHNQMLNMFDAVGGMNIIKHQFINNSTVKEALSLHNLNMLNDSVEHMLNSVLVEAVLRGIPVMNAQNKYINKEGKEVSQNEAASLFDMLYLDENGVLKMNDLVKYTKYNLMDNYHENGKQSINYLIKKQIHNLFGVYDNNMKAEVQKHWYGKLLMMFKNFFLSQAKYRYQGFSTSHRSKNELTEDELNFNNAEQEYTEGVYTTFVRTFIPLLKGFNLTLVKENLANLSDYEKANLKQAFFEISFTAIILPLLGALLAAGADDDDNLTFFFIYCFRRLESELSQFRNPMELNRMISNPVAANRFIQNAGNLITDIITPINFSPDEHESYFDWLSENNKGENKLWNSTKKVLPKPIKDYKELYNLLER